MIAVNHFPTDPHPKTQGARTYPTLSGRLPCPHGCCPLQKAERGTATTTLRQQLLNCLVPSLLAGACSRCWKAVGEQAGHCSPLRSSPRLRCGRRHPGAGPVSATSSSELIDNATSSPCPLPESGEVKQWQEPARGSPASLQSPTHLGGGGDGDPGRSRCDLSQLSLSELIIHIAQGKPASRMLTRLALLISSPHCKSFI